MKNAPTRETIDILRTFAGPALAIGLLDKADLDDALYILELAASGPTQDRLITFRAAAAQLGVSTRTVARMLVCEELSGKRLRAAHAQTMRIYQSSVDAVLAPDSVSLESKADL